MFYDQTEFDVRCEWGLHGVENLSESCAVIIVVDVLSFSTCVEIATSRGALVYPYVFDRVEIEAFARERNAVIARKKRRTSELSLSPSSLLSIIPNTRLVLPSPNGSQLSVSSKAPITLAGCLRNAEATAQYAASFAGPIGIVPCGERWSDGLLRPAIEDLIGAGAIISKLQGRKSPEALVAQAAFLAQEAECAETLRCCSSGKELIERGWRDDVLLASQLNISGTVAQLVEGCYCSVQP